MIGAGVHVSVAHGVATVVLDNPASRNAITRSMCLDIQDTLPQLEADPDVTVVAFRGAGGSFSAGAQLTELESVLMDRTDEGIVDQLSRTDLAITSLAKPTVALVDGACMGGGWQLASACDFIVASERSTIGITPAKLGILYPRAGVDRLVRQVGAAAAKYIVFTGQTFPAARALELGLVAEVVTDGEFSARCDALVAALVQRSRFTIHAMKHLIDIREGDPTLDDEWRSAWSAMADGPDMRIGIAAFLNHEQPRFRWKP
jgi:enoyl-CoA hydratase/carnithine racemase